MSVLHDVIYTAGKVFDGLQSSRSDTERFLRTGDETSLESSHDEALLRDLKQVAQLAVESIGKPIDADLIIEFNARMTRSASIEPGVLRKNSDRIGVNTAVGRHMPPALTSEALNGLLRSVSSHLTVNADAATLFLAIARAQPFKDGNKRTAIFAANTLLLKHETGTVLTVPFSESDATVAQKFNEHLARAYIFNEDEPLIRNLTERGINRISAEH